MYAKNLLEILHRALSDPGTYDDTQIRFEKLRGYGLLPRSRDKANQRLSNEEIASSILGFVPTKPGWAGHVALCLGGLLPVGGVKSSFKGSRTLLSAMAILIENLEAQKCLVHLTLSIARKHSGDEYHGKILYENNGERKCSSYVSKYATTQTGDEGAEGYDHDIPKSSNMHQLVLGPEFFKKLSSEVNISRQLNLPLKTDWREYENEEELNAFHKRLGAKNNSDFLQVGVKTDVMWPKEPTCVHFNEHKFVLFPKTKEYSHSISIDLRNEQLNSEEARTLLNRFLSLLSWCDDRSAILRGGWSGSPIPCPVPRENMAFSTTPNWMFNRTLPKDTSLLNCLSYYREGLNASESGIISSEVLSFFKVFEVGNKDGKKVRRWVDEAFEEACSDVRPEILKQFHYDRGTVPIDEYIYKNCRVATAHAANDYVSDVDTSPEVSRLYVAADIMRALARHFIRTKFHFSESYFSD